MTIMALAHERAGSRELAGEQLARAVEVSGQARAGEPALRPLPACRTSGSARPRGWWSTRCAAPRTTASCCSSSARSTWRASDWARAAQVAALLREQEGPEAAAMAASLETASLRGQGRAADAAAALEGLAGADGGNVRAMADLVQGYVEAGDLDAAQRYLDGVLAKDPASVAGRLLQRRARPAAAAIPPPPRPATARWSPTPLPCRRRIRRSYALPRRPGPRPPRRRRRSTPGSPPRPESAALRFAKAGAPRAAGRHRRRHRRLRGALRPRTAARRSWPTTSRACSPATATIRRAWSAPSPSPGGCAARTCR